MDRAARGFAGVHVALIAFSTIALTTFLSGVPPDWLTREPAQTVYQWGWLLSGPSYVVAGAIAIILHAASRFGWTRAGLLFAAGAFISLAAEVIGTSTGLPFGDYSYTALLGYKIGGLVPFPIPLSWFYMVYASLAVAGRFLPASDGQESRTIWSLAGGAILTAWDVSMDPAMSNATSHWLWHSDGFFYGMPLINWIGWFLTGSIVARAMIAVVAPHEFAAKASASRLPIVVYAANGFMPIAICLRHGLWWAAVPGALAMGLPLVWAVRTKQRIGLQWNDQSDKQNGNDDMDRTRGRR